ncbi:transposase [Nonomuraea sp. KM90]
MPWPAWLHGNGGRPEKYCRRLIMDAIRYVVDNGIKWRKLPPTSWRPGAPSTQSSPAGGKTVISMPCTTTCANKSG